MPKDPGLARARSWKRREIDSSWALARLFKRFFSPRFERAVEENEGPRKPKTVPPPGVALRRRGAAGRIEFGGGRTRVWAFRAAWTLSFFAAGYRVEPAAGLLAGVAAAALLWALPALRRFPPDAGRRAVCWDAERVWVERSPGAAPEWAAPTRAAEGPALAGRSEPLPLESMPRAAVESVRLDRVEIGGAVRPRLLVEAEHGRLELVGRPGERAALEWARDRLRDELLD